MFTRQLKERDSLTAALIHAASINSANWTPTFIDMQKFNRAIFILDLGTLGSSATVDMQLYESANANGASNSALVHPGNSANATITQLTAANATVSFEVRADQMTKRYLGAKVTVGVAASVCALVGIGSDGRYNPVTGNDDTSVVRYALT